MISFAYPKLLYLLLLLPLIAGLYLLARYARRRNLERFGKLGVLLPLMPEASAYKPWIKLTLRLLALAL
ncbi:MAG: BatA domain-containing protein, partial [Paramuribaculum sp.]|nr:BatA domain-containing protein [Paramuribaculum sp.]